MARPRDWEQAAARLGLTYEPWGWTRQARLSGTVGSFAVVVAHSVTPEYDSTDYSVSFPPLGLGLSLRRAAPLRRLGRRLGGGAGLEVTGNPQFDRVVAVEGADPAGLATFLDAGRQAAVLRLLEGYPHAVVSDDGIRWSSHSVDPSACIEATLRDLVEAAAALRR